jgi:EAL domain-containing protein (putative c-di-GMP-specific phosphodiesterase class I)
VETNEEAEACRALGCQLAQGYLFGHPEKGPDIPKPPIG